MSQALFAMQIEQQHAQNNLHVSAYFQIEQCKLIGSRKLGLHSKVQRSTTYKSAGPLWCCLITQLPNEITFHLAYL